VRRSWAEGIFYTDMFAIEIQLDHNFIAVSSATQDVQFIYRCGLHVLCISLVCVQYVFLNCKIIDIILQ
jgi:hypothetical protein